MQKKEDKNKIYAVHAPEVECIGKGKAHKKYEFGCKVLVVSTSRNNWIVGVQAHHGNPYDGHLLKSSINNYENLTKSRPKNVFVYKGFRGKDSHPNDVQVFLSGRKLTGMFKKLLCRRAAIEPIIGHLKSDHRLNRNYLLGQLGDKINAILAGVAFNMMKILSSFEMLTQPF